MRVVVPGTEVDSMHSVKNLRGFHACINNDWVSRRDVDGGDTAGFYIRRQGPGIRTGAASQKPTSETLSRSVYK